MKCLSNLKSLRSFLFPAAGAVLGYAYYYYAGCTSGGCAITGNPWLSTMLGGIFGLAVSSQSPLGSCRTCNDEENGSCRK